MWWCVVPALKASVALVFILLIKKYRVISSYIVYIPSFIKSTELIRKLSGGTNKN
jgi:hypothetical protein